MVRLPTEIDDGVAGVTLVEKTFENQVGWRVVVIGLARWHEVEHAHG